MSMTIASTFFKSEISQISLNWMRFDSTQHRATLILSLWNFLKFWRFKVTPGVVAAFRMAEIGPDIISMGKQWTTAKGAIEVHTWDTKQARIPSERFWVLSRWSASTKRSYTRSARPRLSISAHNVLITNYRRISTIAKIRLYNADLDWDYDKSTYRFLLLFLPFAFIFECLNQIRTFQMLYRFPCVVFITESFPLKVVLNLQK